LVLPLVQFALETAMRRGETLDLKRINIDFEGKRVASTVCTVQ